MQYAAPTDRQRPVKRIVDFRMGCISQQVEDGGNEVTGTDYSVNGESSLLVGLANNASTSDPATGQGNRKGRAPMVASGILVDLGRSSKFPPCHHGHIIPVSYTHLRAHATLR